MSVSNEFQAGSHFPIQVVLLDLCAHFMVTKRNNVVIVYYRKEHTLSSMTQVVQQVLLVQQNGFQCIFLEKLELWVGNLFFS